MNLLDSRTHRRGRPTGSGKLGRDRRQRRDYRFAPTTLRSIEQGRRLIDMTETAFVEAAIQHYVDFLRNGADETEQWQARAQDLERKLVAEQTTQTRRVAQPSSNARLPSEAPGTSPSRHKPTYQIYLKHAPGSCPHLPEEFAYLDLHQSIEPRQCPIHRVFAHPCAIAIARERVERIKREVPGIVQIWLDKGGYSLPRDCWRKEDGRWIRDD